MTATGIVAFFSFLSACSAGANGSVGGLLTMLSAMRYVALKPSDCSNKVDIFLVSSSVLAWVQNILVGRYLHLNNQKSLASLRRHKTGGLPWLQVRNGSSTLNARELNSIITDTMIDFGFVIAAFVPLVLLWM